MNIILERKDEEKNTRKMIYLEEKRVFQERERKKCGNK